MSQTFAGNYILKQYTILKLFVEGKYRDNIILNAYITKTLHLLLLLL